ncbi:MAG TPA: guanylate kinase [Pyrinomonadaceae bacterium]|nr:guanylate kinase [Pyrinomonadaceae bacterium]
MSSEMSDATLSAACVGATASRGMLVVVSSPSGGGKGTLIRRVLKTVPDLGYSVSYTTREPREGETSGRDYFFVSMDEFKAMESAGEFLEWASVHGHFYGTSCSQVEREMNDGRDIILEIDVQGAASVRRIAPSSVTVFILPPSFEILKERLIARGTEDAEDLAIRLGNARAEVEHYREFSYVIVNDDADRAAAQLASIIYAERARRERQERAAERVLATFN